MKPKKPLHIAYIDLDDIKNPLLAGGQATATYEVGKRLASHGHTVTVYCSKYPGAKDRIEDGITYKHVGVDTGNIKMNNALFILSIPFFVPKITDADIIIECFTAPISTLFTPLFTKKPVVVLPSMFNAAAFAKKYFIPFHIIEQLGMKLYKYMLPYSTVDNAKAKRLNPDITTRIVSQGVDDIYFQIKPEKPEYILFLGRFDIDQKGIDLLLEAYAKVKDTIKYPLVIAGRGPDEEKIQKLIKEYNLDLSVRMVGAAYGEKKCQLMAKALYTAFPSRHDEMCLWALESLAGGLPLIGFDIPESAWMTKEISMKSAPFDTSEYAKILMEATQPEHIEPMRKASRSFAQTFPWSKVVTEFEQFFYEVLRIEQSKQYDKNN